MISVNNSTLYKFRYFYIVFYIYRIAFVVLLLPICFRLSADPITHQGVIPQSLILDQRWNYDEYTDLVIPTIDWLQSTAIDTNSNLRTRHNNFLMYWLQKNEQVVVHMPEYLLRFQNASRELYFIYSGGWIKHALQTGDSSRVNNGTAATKAVLDFYKNDMGVPQNDYLDHLVEIEQENKLQNLFDSAENGAHTYISLIKPHEKHDYAPNENYFNFKYTGINFIDTRSLKYRYKLDGYYDKWIVTNEEHVTFPNLPAGDYNFIVQASIYPNFANAVEDSYYFSIAAPFYKQSWFLISVILLCIGSGYLYMKKREKSLKHIAELQQQKVMFEYQYLKSQVNPHFLFNSLNTLTNIIEESPKSAVVYTNHLADLYRNMLAQPDRNLVLLKDELAILSNYIHIQKNRFNESLQVNIDIPDSCLSTKQVVYLSLQLLVENAIKHNVVSKDKPLSINITIEGKYIVISNPIQPKMSTEDGSKMGLANISRRYALNTTQKVSYGEENGQYVVRLPLL